jgi:hypothetical protein
MISIEQLEHQAAGGGKTQAALVLAELEAHVGEWVDMPRLSEVSGSLNVHSRISDLNRARLAAGLPKIDWRFDTKRHPVTGRCVRLSQYRLPISSQLSALSSQLSASAGQPTPTARVDAAQQEPEGFQKLPPTTPRGDALPGEISQPELFHEERSKEAQAFR